MPEDLFEGWQTVYTGRAYARYAGGRSLLILYLGVSWGFLISDAGRVTGRFNIAWTAEQARDEGLAALETPAGGMEVNT